MKKFLINIAIFFAIVAVVDFSLGKVFHYLQARAGGRTGAEYYVCEKATEDIIIMGSSRAVHHYLPEIISKETGLNCFNAGQDGNGIIMQYGRWLMMKERYAPKLIIYDVTADFDILSSDNMAYVDRLKPFCCNQHVKEYLTEVFPMESYKLMSNMYRYNYKFIEMGFDYVRKGDYSHFAGYIPEFGRIRKEVVEMPEVEKKKEVLKDETKLKYMEAILYEAQTAGTQVVLVVSPSWHGGPYDNCVFSEIEGLASKYNALFLNYIDSSYSENPDCFVDSYHLNDEGARAFTKDVIDRIQL